MGEIRLVDRDYQIFRELERWRVVLSRHIQVLAGFSGQRACERRLKKLIEAGYIHRNKVLYGVPSIYKLAKSVFDTQRQDKKVRVEQIAHDIAVLDVAVYLHRVKCIAFSEMTTEKQLHSIDGFGVRRHRPDFVIKHNLKTYCVEVELSLKAKARLEANIQANFMEYDHQIWIVPDKSCKIYQILEGNRKQYPNIKLLGIQEVTVS